MISQEWLIPDGFRIEEFRKNYDIDDAVSFLSGRGGNRITEARRVEDDRAELVGHRLVCPHCRSVVPAYALHLQPLFGDSGQVIGKPSRNAIEVWGGAQSSFWEDPDETLMINFVYIPHKRYTCPNCHRISMPARGVIPVRISNDRKRVTVGCSTTDLGELIRIPWNVKPAINLALPFHEEVTFNFKTGRAYITLFDNNRNCLAVRNIAAPSDWEHSRVYTLLAGNTLIKRKVVHCFQTHWSEQIPFEMHALTPDLLVKLAAYMDYPASFYAKIPSAEGEYRAERSFRSVDPMMRTAKHFQEAVSASQIPRFKSFKRLLYSNPDYGFYLPEIEILSRLFPNPDNFRELFGRSFTYSLLSFLHQYQQVNVAAFFADYIRCKGAKSLLAKLDRRCEAALLYALNYSCLSRSAQAAERAKWRTDRHVRCVPKAQYALPMRCNVRIPDSTIDGFRFVQLRSREEYAAASKELHNCLKHREITDYPVFVIRKKQNILGAIEVNDRGHVLQVRGQHNRPLPDECKSAYKQWLDKFYLTEIDYPEDPGDEDEDYYRMRTLSALIF